MKLAINSLIIASLLACKPVGSILVGNSSASSSNEQQQTKQYIDRNNLTLPDDNNNNNHNNNNNSNTNNVRELDSSSTFYYEADAFLLNKPPPPPPSARGHEQDRSSSFNNANNGGTTNKSSGDVIEPAAPPASFASISVRNGRMLDLDALVGDLAASRANKQRSQSGDRQSRNLIHSQLQNLDLVAGKRLHIQGFIPIIGVKDEAPEDGDDQQQQQQQGEHLHTLASMAEASKQRQKSLMSHRQLSMVPMVGGGADQLPPASLPYGQSSIGHASFNVQRYLNSGQQQQQLDNSNHIGSQQVEPKYSAHFGPSLSSSSSSSSSVVETLKKPIKKLTSTFVGSVSGHSGDKELATGASGVQAGSLAQQNCLCVPFYMCKNGFISESSLGRSQVQQLITQQQQLGTGQQPRQLMLANTMSNNNNNVLPLNGDQLVSQSVAVAAATAAATASSLHKGSVESVPVASGQSYANSFVPVDERSFDREIVTVPPLGANLDQASNSSSQTLSSATIDVTGQMLSDDQANESTKLGGPLADSQLGPTGGGSGSANSSQVSGETMTSADGQQAVNNGQSSDYSQEILGRMLGLKAPSLPFVSGSSSSARGPQSSAGGVCGLLRTCCSIPAHQLPLQQQQQFSKPASNLYQSASSITQQQELIAPQQQLQRFQAPSGNQFQQQISRMQPPPQQALYSPANNHAQFNHYHTDPMQQLSSSSSSSLTHRTSNQYGPVQRMAAAASPSGPLGQHQLAQYARATSPVQSMQTFQQPQQPQQLASMQQLYQSQQQQPQPGQAMRATTSTGNQQQQLGTRKLLEGRCGLRQSSGVNGRVQNLQYSENAAEFGEYPAQAAILKRLNGSESLFVCSGTLISQSWVATAAHCIRKHLQGELKVRLGEWDVHRDDEFYGYVEKEVRDLVIHPEFVAGNLINDIALLRLDSPVDPTLPHINPACLPALDESFARQKCWVTGWGKDSFGQKGSFQAVLQEVELPVLANANCEHALRQTRLGPHYRLHPGFICAGGEGGRDACEGDGGSGLYCVQEGGVIKVAGLVSWGIGCGQAGVPGVYVGIAHYRPWIENIIAIDEDIYSPYNSLPFGMPNTLISERSNGEPGSSNSTAALQQVAEAGQQHRDNSLDGANSTSTSP